MSDVEQDLSATEANDGNYNSFDDLDSMTNTTSDAELMKEAVKEVKENNDTVMSEIKEELKSDQVSEKSTQENLEDIGDNIQEELTEEIKQLHARHGENEYELPEGATLTLKIDGEEQEVSLQDLKSNYSGKVAYDKKFQELGSEKKTFQQERAQIEKYVGEFGDLARAGDKMGAMQYLASLSGMDALQFQRELREQVLGKHQELLGMDDEQKRAYELQEENEFLKHNRESEQKLAEQHKADLERDTRINEVQETLNIDNDQWDDLVSEVEAEYDGEITPEVVGQYAFAKEIYGTAEQLLSQVDESLASNDDVVEEIATIMLQNPDFTNDDVLEIISEEFGSPKKQTSSRKATASARRSGEIKEAPTKNTTSKIDTFYSFDQLED